MIRVICLLIVQKMSFEDLEMYLGKQAAIIVQLRTMQQATALMQRKGTNVTLEQLAGWLVVWLAGRLGYISLTIVMAPLAR
jgi:hypothetical protein